MWKKERQAGIASPRDERARVLGRVASEASKAAAAKSGTATGKRVTMLE